MKDETKDQIFIMLIFTFLWGAIGHVIGTTFQIALVGASIFAIVNRLYNKL